MSLSEPVIHPSAVISKEAQLAGGVKIGPGVVINGPVEIGEGTIVGPHCVFTGSAKIGKNNEFKAGVVIDQPQDLSWKPDWNDEIVIADNNLFREYVTLHRGSLKIDDSITRIGSNGFFMCYSHVGHNAVLGDYIVMTNASQIAGHSRLGDYAWMAGITGTHRFQSIGRGCFIGAGAYVTYDIPPWCWVAGGKILQLNERALTRMGVSDASIEKLRQAFNQHYRQKGLGHENAVKECERLGLLDDPFVREFVEFKSNSYKGKFGRYRELFRKH